MVAAAATYREPMPVPRLSAHDAALVVANATAGVTLLVPAPDRRTAILFGTFVAIGLRECRHPDGFTTVIAAVNGPRRGCSSRSLLPVSTHRSARSTRA